MENRKNQQADELGRDSAQSGNAMNRNIPGTSGPGQRITNPPDMSPDSDNTDAGAMAANPNLSHEEVVSADALPSEKKITSAIPGAEEEGKATTEAASAGGVGTHGAAPSSEGRKGNPDNYGANQTGPGLATGPAGPVTGNE